MNTAINLALLFLIAYQIRSIYLGYKAPNIIPEELESVKKATKGKLQIIDVRSKGRFDKSHIKGSKNIHITELTNKMDKIPKDKKIVLVSNHGTQTGRAVMKMLKEGYDVVNLKGGYRAWNKYQRN